MKKGLVLEGGAMRGLFTAGVIDVMMENNIEYDGAIGVSAGATFGCNYKSKQIGRVFRYNLNFAHDPRFASLQSLIKTGDLYGADFCYHRIPDEFDPMDYETYRNNPMEFYVVCTNAQTGKAEYFLLDKMDEKQIRIMRASASMPVVSNTVEIDGIPYLDGGIADSIPIRAFENLGYDRNVVVLTRPLYYRKKTGASMKLIKPLLKDQPKVMEALENRADVYNQTLDYIKVKEMKKEIFVIRPEYSLHIGKVEHDTSKIQEAYVQGREVMSKQIDALKEFLNQ